MEEIKVIPALLEYELTDIKRKIASLEHFVNLIHIDIADGKFVENTTYQTISEIEKLKTQASLELHLMVTQPEKYLPQSNEVIKKIIMHIESASFSRDLLNEVQEKGFALGLALNPETDFLEVEPFLDYVDCVQFMTITPGFQGQYFLSEVLEKIKDFHERFPETPIEVDGGINPKNAKLVAEVGATLLVSGSYIQDCKDILSCFYTLEEKAEQI